MCPSGTVRARIALACLLAMLCFPACDSCQNRNEDGHTPMCGKCARSGQCQARLACVNGVCETAPPSCHVQIGL